MNQRKEAVRMKVVRAMSMDLHPEAWCTEEEEDVCAWFQSASPQTRDLAKDHVRTTGHEVVVETSTRDLYKRAEQ